MTKKVKINLESSGICLPFVVENLKSTYQDISAVADADGLKSADIEKSQKNFVVSKNCCIFVVGNQTHNNYEYQGKQQ